MSSSDDDSQANLGVHVSAKSEHICFTTTHQIQLPVQGQEPLFYDTDSIDVGDTRSPSGRSFPSQHAAPVLSSGYARAAIPSQALDSSTAYQGNLLTVPAVTATSPMISDLLLALQHKQDGEKKNVLLNNKVERTPRLWTNPQRVGSEAGYCDDEDDNFSEYHSPSDESVVSEHNSGKSIAESGLRASLDAGMAAVGRWVRSRKSSTPLVQPQEKNESVTLLRTSTRSLTSPSVSTFRTRSQIETENAADDDEQPYPETNDARHHRQRSVSEPEMRDFALYESSSILRQRRRSSRREQQRERSNTGGHSVDQYTMEISTASRQSLHSRLSTEDAVPVSTSTSIGGVAPTMDLSMGISSSSVQFSSHISGYPDHMAQPGSPIDIQGHRPPSSGELPEINDQERAARIRWIRINRGFQHVMSWVTLLFSFLLFAILICWVMLTSTYVMSVQKSCDVPLKTYFWLVTFQLVLDVFRNDVIRFVFNWDARSNQRTPPRVIIYNVAYLIYALMVLRLGVRSVIAYDEVPICRSSAPDLFKASVAFVSLSIAAWTTILFGYLVPLFIVVVLLSWNGYSPSGAANGNEDGTTTHAVFPAAYSTSGAPPGCIDELPVMPVNVINADASYPNECSICMDAFSRLHNSAVATKCNHIFHKRCLAEWLRQARSCPVCRDDIPSTLMDRSTIVNGAVERSPSYDSSHSSPGTSTIPIGPSGRPVVGLLLALRRQTNSLADNTNTTMDLRRTEDDATAIASMEMEAGQATGETHV